MTKHSKGGSVCCYQWYNISTYLEHETCSNVTATEVCERERERERERTYLMCLFDMVAHCEILAPYVDVAVRVPSDELTFTCVQQTDCILGLDVVLTHRYSGS